MQLIGEETKTQELFDIASRTTVVGTYGSKVIERGTARSCIAILNSAKSAAGSTTSLAIKMQESDAVTRGVDSSSASADNDVKLRSAADTAIKLSKKFTQSGARQISKVFLKLKSLGSITAGKIVTARIETDSTGDPSGTLVHADATASVLCSAIATSYGWVEFAFSRPIDLANATVYHIVLIGDYDVSSSNCIILATDTVASGGDYNIYTTTWGTMSTTQVVNCYAEQYNFSDISSYTFTAVDELAASHQAKEWSLLTQKQYLRAKATVTGTSADFTCGASIVIDGALRPVS
jgi:hypothetical protein